MVLESGWATKTRDLTLQPWTTPKSTYPVRNTVAHESSRRLVEILALVWNADCERFDWNGTFCRFFSSLKLKMSNISRGFDHSFFKILYSQPAVSFTLYAFESWVLHQVWLILYFRLVRDHTEGGKRVSSKIDIWGIGIGCASVVSLVLPLTSYCSVWSWS